MQVIVTGATGFVGRALVATLREQGHGVVAATRSSERATALLGPDVHAVTLSDGAALAAALGGVDGVVHLAGEPLFAGRWSAKRKQGIWDSRVGLTRRLVEALRVAEPRPRVLVSTSAVGYYGDRGDEPLDEHAAPGDDFLGRLCQRWEEAAADAEGLGLRVVRLRLGIVLGPGGGALDRMAGLFRLGLGGRLGSGRQAFPWVHRDDVVGVALRALLEPGMTGPFNLVAPQQRSNAQMTRALARALRRPAVLPVPAFALRAALGEAAGVLLAGQRVLPGRLLRLGYRFVFPELEGALAAALGSGGGAPGGERSA